jgi:hypothetical protein
VPVSWPVEASKVAQDGLFAMLNISRSPSASVAAGLNEYDWPAWTLAGAVPEIDGAWLAGVGVVGVLGDSDAPVSTVAGPPPHACSKSVQASVVRSS